MLRLYIHDISRPFKLLGTIDAKVTLINVKTCNVICEQNC